MAKKPGWSNLPKGWTDESFQSFWAKITEENPEHPFTACVEKLKGKVNNPEGLCAAAKDKALGTTYWRGPSKNKKARKERTMSLRDFILDAESKNPGVLRQAAQALGVPGLQKTAKLRVSRERATEILMNSLPEFLANVDEDTFETLYLLVHNWKRKQMYGERRRSRREKLEAEREEAMMNPPPTPEKEIRGPKTLLKEELRRNKDEPLRVGEEKQGDHLRVLRYADHFRISDLTNAGQRGKSVEVLTINCRSVRDDQLVDDLGSALLNADMDTAKDWARRLRQMDKSIRTRVFEVKGVDVLPASEKTIRFDNGKIGIHVSHDTATIRNLLDKANNAMLTPVSTRRGHQSKRSLKQLSRWIRDNLAALKRMDYQQVTKALRQANIKYSTVYI